MKYLVTVLSLLFVLSSYAQSKRSGFEGTQTIQLSISTPQPRLRETFQVKLDIEHLRANIFQSLADKVRISTGTTYGREDEQMIMQVTARKKGSFEIGPLEFTLDHTHYRTNKVVYEVVDALPDTDQGLWMRKVKMNDTAFCLILEQRIPARSRTEKKGNTITIASVPKYDQLAKLKTLPEQIGMNTPLSSSNSSFASVEINGERREFMYGYAVYYFTLSDPAAKVVITKDNFENLPADYRFQNIQIP